MSATHYPHRIQSVHLESIEGELCVYDTAGQRVHSLNHTAAFVWQRCDGRTAPAELAAALSAEAAIDDAEAVVHLALQELAAAQLLVAPLSELASVSRRDLLRRGIAAAALPAIYSIVAPSPAAAQSPPPGAPTLTSVSPNQGTPGTTVPVTVTGTNFVVGATTVTVNSGGVTATNVMVGSATSLTATIVIDLAAVTGAHTVTVTTAGGTSGPVTFTVSPTPPTAPTLTSISPNQGLAGATVAVTLTGTNFVVAATTVNVNGAGVTVNNVVVGSSTSLTASFVLNPAAAVGPRTVTVTTAGGTSGGQAFTVGPPPAAVPTLTNVAPNQGVQGATVAVTLTGTNFVVAATTVAVAGGGVTVNNIVVGSTTSLTANFVLEPVATVGPRTVTVTTAGGTSGPQTFTISVPPGFATFNFTGNPETFTVPGGVVSVTIQATGAGGGRGVGMDAPDPRGMGGRTTATVSVVSGALLTVRVGGIGPEGAGGPLGTAGGFNGGGGSVANGGGGGGASSVHDASTPLVIAGGGGGGGGGSLSGGGGDGFGGHGGGLTADAGETVPLGGGGGGGGTQAAGGAGGARGNSSGTDGTAGTAGTGGTGGLAVSGVFDRGGGGGGGGHFGGGGGGGGGAGIGDITGGGGGGGSSFTAPGATDVAHELGVNNLAGSVTISW